MDERAFWISPEGTVYPVTDGHIASVIADPGLFGVTAEYIEGVYRAYKDPFGREGMAWERILKELITKKWIRIRDHGEYLSVQVFSLDRNSISRVRSFFRSVPGRYSRQTQVRQAILNEGTTRITTVAEIEADLCDGR